MGDVFEAEDTKIEKRVAVKLLKRQYSLKKDIVVRFRREALSSARIGHANIIDVTDLDQTPDGHLYLVMEFLAGSSLSRVLRRNGRMTLDTAVRVFRQIAAALQAAHDKGIIHRDLKPGNIFILDKGASDQNFVKVLDFGIAFIKDEAGTEARLTRAGAILGTPDYMSPEQARGDDLDQRADIYSAGVILYEMLAGAPPFQADTYMGVINKHMYEEPPRLTERVPDLHLPPKFEDALRRSLAKAADERFGSMDEFMDALEDALRLHGASTGKFPSLQTPKASVAGPATEVDGTPRAGRRGSSPSLTPAAMEAVAGPARARAARMPRWVPPLGAAVALVCGTLGALAIYERRGDSAADGQEDEPGARRAGTGGGAAGAEDGDGSRTAAAPDADRAASAGAGASPSATPTAGTAAAPVTAAPYALFTPDFGTAGAKRPATGAPGHAPVPGRTASVVPDTHAPGTHAPVTVADGIEVKKATVQFESAPAGVVVMEGLKSICITPCFGSFDDPRKARTIEFVRAGFKTVTRTFSPLTETTMKVTLEPTTAVKPETAAPKPAGILTPDLP
jgi:serine/threonine-protein kinase